MTDEPSALSPAALRAGLVLATKRLAAVASAEPDVDVPTCPGWTVGRVAVHVGRIHRWVAAGLEAPPGVEVPAAERPPPDTDLGAWLVDGCTLLNDAFDAAGPKGGIRAPGWERPAAWWRRRTCHETTIHAWDVEAATGAAAALGGDLALDGIAEIIDVLLPGAFDPNTFGDAATMHLHTTDPDVGPGEWLVWLGPDGVRSERRHAKGDVAVRGPAADVLLWLWGRLPTDALDVIGDAAVAERYRAASRY